MRRLLNKWTVLIVSLVLVVLAALTVQDWHQLWVVSSAPDNVPIVAMLFLVPFFTWLGIKQAMSNDRLIDELEKDPKLAKTHHRKVEPWRPGWAREIHVWPYLVRVEFLATVIVTVVLFVWSITLNAPLEEPANPNLTMNPSKAPWYFLGLQELVSFSAFMGGIGIPSIVLLGLGLIPFLERESRGTGEWFGGPGGISLVLRSIAFGLGAVLAIEAFAIRFGWIRQWWPAAPQLLITLLNPGTVIAAAYAFFSLSLVRRYDSTRAGAVGLFTCFLCGYIVLTVIGTHFRGPNWDFFWSPDQWPGH